MAKQTKTAKIETFDGENLTNPIPYSFDYESYESVDAAKTAGVWPNEADTLAAIIAENEKTARAKAYQARTKVFRLVKARTIEAIRQNIYDAAIVGRIKPERAKTMAAMAEEDDDTKAAASILARLLAGENVNVDDNGVEVPATTETASA